MNIEPFYDSRTSTLTYVVSEGTDAIVIDPVLDYEPGSPPRIWTESVERVAAYLEEKKLKLRAIFETHPHADHLTGSQWLKERFGAPVYIGEGIKEVQAEFQKRLEWPTLATDGSQFDHLLRDGERVNLGALHIDALATPGHTPACMSLKVGDAVFTGDALFLDDVGVGRCDFPRGNAGALYDSVTSKLFSLPDDTRLYTGHDYPPPSRQWRAVTTVREAKANNVQLNAGLSRDEFVARRTARDATLKPPRLLRPSLEANLVAGRNQENESFQRPGGSQTP